MTDWASNDLIGEVLSSTNLFEGLGVEASEGIVLNGIADLDWSAADFTVLDVGVTAY